MEKDKMGVLGLSGLIIGPILGSGIIILPPIIYNLIKEWAIFAWIAIIGVSCIFAFIFGFLSRQFPGDGGVTNAVESVFGLYIKRLTSFYLIIGVVFGAVAVLMTAAGYIGKLSMLNPVIFGYSLLILCIAALLTKASFIGKVAFLMTTISAGVLFVGGMASLAKYHKPFLIEAQFNPFNFGYALLLLFWTIFGWEIIGNYSAEIRNPAKTITRAIILSASVIAIVDLTIAAAVQWTDISKFWIGDITITTIIYTVFGRASSHIMALLTLFLCSSTYLLFVGGVIRLIASMSEDKLLPGVFSRRAKTNVPVYAVMLIFVLHLLVILLVQFEILNIEKLVALSNGFFLANAFLGIGAGVKLVNNWFIKLSGAVLAAFFICMLFYYSSKLSLIVIAMLAVYYITKQVSHNHRKLRRAGTDDCSS